MIFNLFKTKSKLGIDIGTSAIKVVELSQKGGRFVLENYGFFEFKGSNAEKAEDQSILKLPDQEIVWGIREVLKTAKFNSRDVVSGISSFSTFSTVLELPYLSEEDLAKAIPFEARKYVPVPLDEVTLDWSIVGIVDQPNASKPNEPKTPSVEVFFAAVPKDETARFKRIMADAGLNLVALELENAGLIRGVLGNDLSPTAIVNIGGRSASIVIVDKGYERLSHNYEVGGFEVTKAISRALNVSFERVEELKRKLGLSESSENMIREAMATMVDSMVLETKKTISNYEQSRSQKIGRVVLVGGMVNMPNFVSYFKQRLGRDVYIGNAFARVVYPQALEPIIPELSNNFAIAAGLAMREI